MESQSSDVLGGIIVLGLIVVCVVVGLAMLAFWVWMLIHALVNQGLSGSEKVAWVLVILFVQILGAIIYFFVGKPKARRPLPASP